MLVDVNLLIGCALVCFISSDLPSDSVCKIVWWSGQRCSGSTPTPCASLGPTSSRLLLQVG